MIPKIIHYCWFGKNPYPKEFLEYFNGWGEKCPDYKIIEWNEENFDINSNIYVKEAYQSKKWAFVSDYVRLWALYNFGGIYLDTDVEVLMPLDSFLDNHAFSGFESNNSVPTGIIGSEKGNQVVKDLLTEYDNKKFILNDGSMNMHTNVEYITQYFKKNGLIPNNQFQIIKGFALYPNEYFCPMNSRTLEIKCTSNTYTIHHFAGSWTEGKTKKRKAIKKIVGHKGMSFIIKVMDRLGMK